MCLCLELTVTDCSVGRKKGSLQCPSVLSPPTPFCLISGGVLFFKVMEKCLTLGAKKVFYVPADMSSPSEPEKVVQFAVQKLGKQKKNGRYGRAETNFAGCFSLYRVPLFSKGVDDTLPWSPFRDYSSQAISCFILTSRFEETD